MILITFAWREQLLANSRAQAERIADDGNTIDFHPVVKLFTPDANATWLLTELDADGIAPSASATWDSENPSWATSALLNWRPFAAVSAYPLSATHRSARITR